MTWNHQSSTNIFSNRRSSHTFVGFFKRINSAINSGEKRWNPFPMITSFSFANKRRCRTLLKIYRAARREAQENIAANRERRRKGRIIRRVKRAWIKRVKCARGRHRQVEACRGGKASRPTRSTSFSSFLFSLRPSCTSVDSSVLRSVFWYFYIRRRWCRWHREQVLGPVW